MTMNNDDSKNGGKKTEEKINTNAWMTTFSDLCTLLLTFFVLLFSLSSMDDKKLKIAFQNFSGSSGFLFFKEYHTISRPKEIMIKGINQILGDRVVAWSEPEHSGAVVGQDSIGSEDLRGTGGHLIIKPLRDGLKLICGEDLLFPTGRAEIREEMEPVLKKVARFISVSGYQAYIDGHTDSTPIHTEKYATNEELSIARASSVREYLVKVEKNSPYSIALAGYGALKSVASNKTPEGRKRNCRVEIVLKNQKYF
jgi:chemotaxis protein MotB